MVCYHVVRSDAKLKAELGKGKVGTLYITADMCMACVCVRYPLSVLFVCQDPFTARNDSQVYYLRSLAITFIEVGILMFLLVCVS